MKRADIERIIKTGSVKQKIKLYMTDTAMVATDPSTLEFMQLGNKVRPKGTTLMTYKEREMLWDSIKAPKDIEYYENMRKANKAFLWFMDKLKTQLALLFALHNATDTVFSRFAISLDLSETINDLLEIYPDENSRKKASELAAIQLERLVVKKHKEKSSNRFKADGDRYYKALSSYVHNTNLVNHRIKEYYSLLTAITKKELPLKPYKDWLIDTEKDIIRVNAEIQSKIALYAELYKPTEPTLVRYEDIEVAEITDEDVDDFKQAGE